jgi:type IV pilus assembly protein PilY1
MKTTTHIHSYWPLSKASFYTSKKLAYLSLLVFSAALSPLAQSQTLTQTPLFLSATQSQSPLVMLTMARDHKLFYEAYNDYTDLDSDRTGGDSYIEVRYKPATIDYYGYFDSYKCYDYSTTNNRFVPISTTSNKQCSGHWSGDFLNYVTTARIDALRKVLYGGYRSSDTSSETVLERTFIPQDAHAWGKEYHSVARDGYDISQYTPLAVPTSGRYHVFANVTLTSDTSPPLMRVLTNTTYRVWEWVSIAGPVAGTQCANSSNVRANCVSTGSMTDYVVRVEVCKSAALLESNCVLYGTSTYKPVGLLQRQGEDNYMYFGLLTGSYSKNTEGGVLRKAVSSIRNEITSDGRFGSTTETCLSGTNCVNGIISTINKLKIKGFNYSDYSYSCGWITNRQMNDGECPMWGNPIGEMLYETLRYFKGSTSATSSFTYSSSDTSLIDNVLGLPLLTTWTNPYSSTPSPNASPATFASCAKPYSLLLSDVYPSFDSNSVPGNAFATFSGDITGLNASTLGSTIWNNEIGSTRDIFIGQVGSSTDNGPTAKSASSFGNIRGLAPGEPTRQGSYYSASVAYYGHTNPVNSLNKSEAMNTYSVALAAPLPELTIPLGSSSIKILPFAKSVWGPTSYPISPTGTFQPTNQIVDFYIDTIANVPSTTDSSTNDGRPYYKFRINFEDVEQGADHDSDAIATYEIFQNSDTTISVKITSEYASGSIIQHQGFVISGTTNDGAYLVVRDSDTASGTDQVYSMDCRTTTNSPASCAFGTSGSGDLPLTKTLTFTPSTTASSTLLNNPLWYAAKWGSFTDKNGNATPDGTEWDANGDGTPDNYFLVTNPLNMETQLTKALDNIKKDTATAAATSANSFSLQTDSVLYQARFSSEDWTGELNAYPINSSGTLGSAIWEAQSLLASNSSRAILTYDPDRTGSKGIEFQWSSMSSAGTPYLRTALNKNYVATTDSSGEDRVTYLRGTDVSGMRTRPSIRNTTIKNKLGDIVNSQPQYVGIPLFGYAEATYASFRSAKATRTPMVYVGANDGMLHGFQASNGVEKIAYIPSEMYRTRNGGPLLSKLTHSTYGDSTNPHNYLVDGTPTIGDVCTTSCSASTDWKTILVGGLNAGGQGIYALDITNPSNFSESNASSIVMWEFNDRNDTDTDTTMQYGLGYTFSRPVIARVCTDRDNGNADVPACNAGRWVVIFGSGYNNTDADSYASTSGYAILYVLDALTGTVIKKINTKTGTSSSPNGLSTPAAVDIDGDDYIDYVYAGDIKGNMWKFNLVNETASNWSVAYGNSSNPAPLYTAKDGTTARNPQAITTAPDAILHPDGGILVMFGTGSYIRSTDLNTTNMSLAQSIYGIRDNGAAVSSTNRNNLVQQSINTSSQTVSSVNYRTVSNNTIDWNSKDGWFIDLPGTGERIAYEPRVIGEVLAFTSIVPTSDVCDAGGSSWDYYVDALTGGRLSYSPFTAVSSITVDSTTYSPAARESKVGVTPMGTLITQGKGKGTDILCGSTGNCETYGVNLGQNIAGRLSWREITSD